MPDQREDGPGDDDGGQTVAMGAAGEEVTQPVAHVDARGIQERLAGSGYAHAGEDGLLAAELIVPEAHRVAARK